MKAVEERHKKKSKMAAKASLRQLSLLAEVSEVSER
jgi:hypothetical protein